MTFHDLAKVILGSGELAILPAMSAPIPPEAPVAKAVGRAIEVVAHERMLS